MIYNPEDWIEYDYNPFILFDKSAKVVTLNNEAQYLLGDVSAREIYALATSYASHSFGYHTTIVDLEFGSNEYYGITVGYKDDDYIGIRLYKKENKKFQNINEDGESVNIYAILDMCISASATSSKTIYKKEFDPTFPEVKLNIDGFVKIITHILDQITDQDLIHIKMYLKVGEYLRINEKKYNIFMIDFSCDLSDIVIENSIYDLASNINCSISKKNRFISISSPMILQ
jgi:hypothetical protein